MPDVDEAWVQTQLAALQQEVQRDRKRLRLLRRQCRRSYRRLERAWQDVEDSHMDRQTRLNQLSTALASFTEEETN